MNAKEILACALWRVCAMLPMKRNGVLFSSFDGKGYSDSPKAIAQALLDSGEDLKLYWLVNTPQDALSLPKGITPIYRSRKLDQIKAYTTTKVWVNNCRQYPRVKRKGQYYLQTWHGFALKMIEKDAQSALPEQYVRMCRQDAAMTDAVVSGSVFMKNLFRSSFWYPEFVEIPLYGTPRNDIFFRETPEISEKIRSALQLPPQQKLVLYAPTFRADHSTDCYALDAGMLKKACEARFGGEWSVLIRLHPGIASKSAGLFAYDGIHILDATSYPDMQELLVGVDLLITDYSSSMFDYALSGKPCIQFALDIEEYKKDRNFYLPLDELPFPMARGNRELEEIVKEYDADLWSARWNAFCKASHISIAEDGQAARRCARWILDKLNLS